MRKAAVRSIVAVAVTTALTLLFSGCAGGGGPASGGGGGPTRVSIGGTVSGLTGTGLVLANNGGDNLSITANGAFTFPTMIATGAAYAVNVVTPPTAPAQVCAIANGSGMAGTSNIASVTVTCGAAVEAPAVYSIGATDAVWDTQQGRLYVSLGANAPVNPNSIAVFDPDTNAITVAAATGLDPGIIRVSDDGQYLYVGLRGASSVQRFTLPASSLDLTIPLVDNAYPGPLFAEDIEVAPNAPHTIAVARTMYAYVPGTAGVVIYDDAAARGLAASGDSIAWGSDASTLYGVNTQVDSYNLYSNHVDANGGATTESVRAACPGTQSIQFAAGLLYCDMGNIFDPAAHNVIGTITAAGPMYADSAHNMVFVVRQIGGFGWSLLAYDATHLTLVGLLPLPDLPPVNGVPDIARHVVRFGATGVAITTSAGNLIVIKNAFTLPAPALGGAGRLLHSATGASSYSVYDLPAYDFVWAPTQSILYLSLPSLVDVNGNSIAAFDPRAGVTRAATFAGSEPGRLSLSGDGLHLYAGHYGATSVTKLAIPALSLEEQVFLGSDVNLGPLYPADIQVAPGSTSTIAVEQSFYGALTPSIAVIDGTVRRLNQPLDSVEGLQWGTNASELFGYHTGADVLEISRYLVDPSGVMLQPTGMESLTGNGIIAREAHFASGLIYGDDGTVFDPSKNTVKATFGGVVNSVMTPDSDRGLGFFVRWDQAVPGLTVYSVDLAHGNTVSSFNVPTLTGMPIRVLRWGSDGLAFNTDAGEFVIVRGTIVTTLPPANSCGTPLGTSKTLAGPQGPSFTSQIVAANATDIGYGTTSGLLYLPVSANSASNANCIVPLDPASGALGQGVFAGSRPSSVSVADDGSVLYVGFNGQQTAERFVLPSMTHDLSIPVAIGSIATSHPVAGDIEVAPGTATTVAIAEKSMQVSPSGLGVAIFDNATPRPMVYTAADLNTLQWATSAATVYGYNVENGNEDFVTLSVGAAGVAEVSDLRQVLMQSGGRIHRGGNLIYGDSGQVLDPAASAVVGQFAVNPAGILPQSVAALDIGRNTAYFAFVNGQSGELTLQTFDISSYALLRSISLGVIPGAPTRIVRWGADGLAVVLASGTIVVVSGTFVSG